MKFKRSPIICILGHVDHGKTTLLDSVRGTAVAKKEAGGITQMIGASYVSREDVDAIAKEIAAKMKLNMTIPGLLFIDTPGHEAFTNLRDRGGSLADLAVLVVDVSTGFQPQTIESIKILQQYKTPFIIAANKIDTVSGWKSQKTTSFLESLAQQPEHVREKLDEKIYGVMGKISEHGFDSERFDRIKDFTRQVAILPISGKTREGLSELLVLIGGLSQRFLGDRLDIDEKGRGKGSIIEVKEEKGLGTTLDVIVYDGILRKGDDIAFMTANGIKRTKIRGLLEPNIGGKDKFAFVEEIVAAAGVKVSAPDLEGAIPGSPIEAIEDFERDKISIEAQFKSVIFERGDENGVVLRADSLGSVEALLRLLKEAGIPVRDAAVGSVGRKDVVSASVVRQNDEFLGVVLGFNVKVLDEAWEESRNSGIPVIYSDIIYRLIEEYQAWVKEKRDALKKQALEKIVWPGKIKVLNGYIFRASKPAIFGMEVIGGRMKKNYRLMNSAGEIVGEVREMQKDKDKVDEANAGDQIAISCDGVIIGKNVAEGDVLYTYMTGDEIKKWESQMHMLTEGEKQLFEEIKKPLRKYF
ncbi:MAG TPA: translation initiation factor IF-2 [Candidatus Bilamarchaeum sp.]|nr:translation initiation factor IF-2 [Candidatus Bilamarchaeum sp.]